ncbi:hypothetical protein EV378_3635 [Pseudonocardia endophytica]|uniref:Uncharacterized protein n=2 Tax=Pseudonocardia endophytica TaxID=401976 RepID=A0A4R1HY90_PSEEN|nr:hypothetical protein EV378_3635 [Pseudonocardia endophytica]
MARWAGTVIGMAALALGFAYLAFGWPVLIVGGPLFVGVVATLVVLLVTERPRRALRDRRDGRTVQTPWRTAAERGETSTTGLMSGFFELSPQDRVPPIGDYRIPAQAGAPEDADTPSAPWSRIARIARTGRPAGV